jgi:hypothetical protein
LAAAALGVPIALISLIDEERQWFKSLFGLSIGEISRNDSSCAHTIAADHMLVVGDATQDQRFCDSPLVAIRASGSTQVCRCRRAGASARRVLWPAKPHPGLSLEQAEMLCDLATLTVALIELGQAARVPSRDWLAGQIAISRGSQRSHHRLSRGPDRS